MKLDLSPSFGIVFLFQYSASFRNFSKSWQDGHQPFHVSVLLAKASMTVSYGTEPRHIPTVPKSIFTATDRMPGLSAFLTNKRVQERICDVLRRLG